MENNEILTNEEVMKTTEEIVNASSGKGFKVAAGIGLAVLSGVVAYKYIGKPLLAKIKAKKEETQEITDVEFNESDVKDEDSEDISE
jgi:hypothetical protein